LHAQTQRNAGTISQDSFPHVPTTLGLEAGDIDVVERVARGAGGVGGFLEALPSGRSLYEVTAGADLLAEA